MRRRRVIGPRVPFVCTVLLLVPALTVSAATYYVDSSAGNDGNAGTDTSAPWKTIGKINGSTFFPGDRILFKAGGIWVGQLNPKGSGAPDAPIQIDQYGEGAKPLIDGAGETGNGVLYFHNQEFWEAKNLELTNDNAVGGDRRGVYISASNFGVIDHIYLEHLDIHNIKGIVGHDLPAKDTGGIGIMVLADDLVDTRFNDLLIEDCTISSVDNTGIFSRNAAGGATTPGSAAFERRKITNLIIRNNRLNDIAKNAMIIRLTDDSCLVERNVCWDTCARVDTGNTIFSRSADGTVFQYNEGYLNHSTGGYDGSLYDADLESYRITFQYSYSHDNAHGLIWFAAEPNDTDTVVRYCVSQNDKGIIFALRSSFVRASFYNNVIYIPSHLSPEIIQERDGSTFEYTFVNNIIYNESASATYQFNDGTGTFDSNMFFGQHPPNEPADPNKILDDPLFVKPGSGGIGLDALGGYMLRPDSPAIDSGQSVSGAPALDFWGNPVPANGIPDRGVHEYTQAVSSLPPPWENADIGDVGPVGIASFEEGIFTLNGSGAEIGGFADAFHFVYQQALEDVAISARVLYVEDTNPEAAAGIMFRASLDDNAPYVLLAFQPGHSLLWQYTQDSGPQETQLFADGFEYGFDAAGWINNNAYLSVTGYLDSPMSAKIDNNDGIRKSLSTAGFGPITIRYARKGQDTDQTDLFFSEWWDGTVWREIERVTAAPSDWMIPEFTLPEEARDNPDFALRFRVEAANAHYVYVDTVEITAASQGRTTIASEIAAPPSTKWVKLVRLEEGISGLYSSDGSVWTEIDLVDIALGDSPFVGMAVTAHNDQTLCTAAFDNVSVTPSAMPMSVSVGWLAFLLATAHLGTGVWFLRKEKPINWAESKRSSQEKGHWVRKRCSNPGAPILLGLLMAYVTPVHADIDQYAEVRVEQDMPYLEPGRSEKMDMYAPVTDNKNARFPGIVIIHGGGWVGGDKARNREINIGTTRCCRTISLRRASSTTGSSGCRAGRTRRPWTASERTPTPDAPAVHPRSWTNSRTCCSAPSARTSEAANPNRSKTKTRAA